MSIKKGNVCIHFFEPGAINYAKELSRQLIDSEIATKAYFSISWQDTYNKFIKESGCFTDDILDDIGAKRFDEFTELPLNDSESKLLDFYDEKIFEGSIWKFIYQDRHFLYKKFGPAIIKKGRFIDRNKLLRVYLYRTDYIYNFLIKNEINLVVFATQDYGTAFGTLVAEVANKLNKKVIIPNISKINSNVNVIDNVYARSKSLESEISKIKGLNSLDYESYVVKAKKLIRDTRSGELVDYYKSSSYRRPPLKNRLISSVMKASSQLIERNSSYKDYHLQRLIGLCLLKLRSFWVSKNVNMGTISELKCYKYVYYPLHIEPEINIMLLGNEITDQLDIVRRIAKNLPSKTTLFVKEHPLYAGIFPKNFYYELSAIPNVKLISTKVNQNELVKNADAVFCISGTTAMEAMMLGINSIVAGIPYFSVCESVYKVENLNDMKETLFQAISKDFDERSLEVFVQALLNTSQEFDVLKLGRASDILPADFLKEEVTKYIELIKCSL